MLAQAPAALRGYVALWDLIAETRLTAVEQQVVCQQINRQHGCHYCLAHHDVLLKQAGADRATREALLNAHPLAVPALESLRCFTESLVQSRGFVDAAQQQVLLDAGYSERQMLDVILILSCKVISNFSNHLTDTPLEPFVKAVV